MAFRRREAHLHYGGVFVVVGDSRSVQVILMEFFSCAVRFKHYV